MAQTTLHDYLQQTEDAIAAGRIDDALTRCQYVLTYFPEALEAQRLVGEAYLAQGHLEDAQQMFDWILMNDPENIITYCDRALVSEQQSDFETALDCYQQAYELSRGNSQIRRQFNELGARTGQHSFMFSRAGLARLYMRGDLLSQAIQEWETVLTTSPDRLDARLGLLETYWYEGLYDQVEQLARQILGDVAGCLKALLLLAVVISEKSMQEAQELLQRAEALDPELFMAQDLFADMITNQPTHPFIKLLKRPPVLLETPSNVGGAPVEEPVVALQASTQNSLPPDAFAHWDDLSEWNGVDTPIKPRQNTLSAPPVFSAWPAEASESASDQAARPVLEQQVPAQQDDAAVAEDPWVMLERPAHPESQEDYRDDQLEVQQAFQESAEVNVVQHQDEEMAVWEAEDQPAEAEFDGMEGWDSHVENDEAFATSAWTLTSKEEYTSATPAWLSMLAQDQPRSPDGAPPTPVAPVQEQKPSAQRSATQQSSEPEPVFSTQPSRNTELQANSNGTDDDEDSLSFGPEWLRSLGATTMDDSPEADALSPTFQQTPMRAEPDPQPKAVFSPWTVQAPELQSQEQAVLSPWTMQVPEPQPQKVQDVPVSEVPAEAEQSFLKTLEDLEQGLRSRGFVPLEPNSLSALTQEAAASSTMSVSQEVSQDEEEEQEESTLSSALAQLGNFAPPSAPTLAVPVASTQPVPHPEPGIRPVEPLWAASLSQGSMPSPRPTVPDMPLIQPSAPSVQSITPASPVQGLTPAPVLPAPVVQGPPVVPPIRIQEPAVVAPIRIDALPGPAFQPKSEPTRTASPSPQPIKVPETRGDALLEDELEMTMKRPAVRLPAAQQRSAAVRQEGVAPSGKGFVGERAAPAANKATGSGSNYKERLLKGYQHQLVGDYDEAMQEYRIIIRNAPELLSEVVSNVRALLKLAPKYSAGYRVLGDAYMRQGEYLQAMEAYNKALTMAKKAKA